ncbi:hypothetical protein TrCOL_g1624 [Triparma columacea]|jgi:hypothetical protein|uniref:Uncharacterized protein n=1 Tax=Triparma columacea TaxID=722753 RepID=A0A9W7LDM1_9STRA|nr:hypothetical protein TrCOL_g1624 [Triparma columacea]
MFSFTNLNPLGLLGPSGGEVVEYDPWEASTASASIPEPALTDMGSEDSYPPSEDDEAPAPAFPEKIPRKSPRVGVQRPARFGGVKRGVAASPATAQATMRKSKRIEVKDAVCRRNSAKRSEVFVDPKIYGRDTGILPSD